MCGLVSNVVEVITSFMMTAVFISISTNHVHQTVFLCNFL